MSLNQGVVVRFASGLLLIGLLVLLGIVGMTFWLGERAQVHFTEAVDARDARGFAVELRNTVLTAESGQRGFLLTGNEIYLAPYGWSKDQARRQLDALKLALRPYGQSEVMIERLATIIPDKFAEMDRTIALKRDRLDADALAVLRSNRGKALMDEANVYFTGVIRAADERLTAAVSAQRTNASWLRAVSVVGGLVIVMVVGAATVNVARYARDLRVARDEVAALNRDLEARIEARTGALAQANEEIRSFAHIVSHDLRAPLVNIMGFTAEIESGVAGLVRVADRTAAGLASPGEFAEDVRAAVADMPEAIAFIRSSTTKMDHLIGAVLKISREGRRTLHPERLDLAEILRMTASAVQHQTVQAGGAISLKVDDVPAIVGDRLSLEQVLGNLFDNAVKYRSKDRPLRIAVTASMMPDDRVSLDIADNGRGIAERDLPRVFDLFRRVGSQDQPGEGIGLAFVRTLVRNLGGEVGVTSVLGEGTTFHVEFPRLIGSPGEDAAIA